VPRSAVPDPTPERRTAEERREALLDVARTLVSEGGPGAVSMGTVADRAEVTRALVYKHFDNRSDILSALYQREAKALDRQLRRQVMAAGDGFEPKLRSFVHAVLEAAGTHGELFVPLRPYGHDSSYRRQQRSWDRRTVDYFATLASAEFDLDASVAKPAISVLLAGIVSLLTQARADRSGRHRAFLEDLFVEMTVASLARLATEPPGPSTPRTSAPTRRR
jgi:AcrR family transcriptional regulator